MRQNQSRHFPDGDAMIAVPEPGINLAETRGVFLPKQGHEAEHGKKGFFRQEHRTPLEITIRINLRLHLRKAQDAFSLVCNPW
jgi:hypothetical protein